MVIYTTTEASQPKTTDIVMQTRADFSLAVHGAHDRGCSLGSLNNLAKGGKSSKTDANYAGGFLNRGRAC